MIAAALAAIPSRDRIHQRQMQRTLGMAVLPLMGGPERSVMLALPARSTADR